VGGVAIGWLGDKIGRKKALLASLALLAAGSILSALAWDFTSLLTFRIFTGIGVGGEWGAGMVLLNEVWRSRQRGFGSCVVQAMSAAGTAMAVLVATFALTNLSEDQAWRVALLFGGLPIILMVFIRAKMPESKLWSEYEALRKAGQLPEEKREQKAALLEIFRGASLRYFVFGALMCGAYIISYQSISIFIPTLMIRDLHGNPGVVRTVTLLFCLFSASGLLLAGYASDHLAANLRSSVPRRSASSPSWRSICSDAWIIQARCSVGRCSGATRCGAWVRARSAYSDLGTPSFFQSSFARPALRPPSRSVV
ncbi:MAG: MFS transporter, partial [Xanthobacteraceae bacterium]|nr:MFS transporter [Xanthobacteraceae bacterium]